MPELPEVEAIRSAIDRTFCGHQLIHLKVHHPDVWLGAPATPTPDILVGETLLHTYRRGKYLSLIFTSQLRLIVHLRMTGQMRLRLPDDPVSTHTHVQFYFDNGRMDFRDVRRFGRLELSRVEDTFCSTESIEKLGPEPTLDTLTLAHLRQEAKRHPNLTLKAFLLNQSVVAGLGNIYADEISFVANIHPARRVRQLKPSDWKLLHHSILSVIEEAVALGGTSFSDYIHLDGSKGQYQEVARVYTRKGQPCLECQTPLIKTRVAGRGTVYCPNCQPAPRGFKP